jgi:trehalose 6-phosphate synthase
VTEEPQAKGRPTSPGERGKQLVVVANRLPVSWIERESPGRQYGWETSPGGLVSALLPILRERAGAWIGWSGAAGQAPEPFDHQGIRLRPVQLSAEELELFYLGFSNATLWPLYHDSVRFPEFRRSWWRSYVDVNQRYAEEAARSLEDGGTVWVHDYQLQLVPAALRERCPNAHIGFFLHIPFPPGELFAQLPWRRQLLEGLLGADVVGFQTELGRRNFVTAAVRYADARRIDDEVLEWRGRRIVARSYPISIDFTAFAELGADPAVRSRSEEIRDRLGRERKIILGVDRLDYTKGIDKRLKAFETLLARRVNSDLPSPVLVQIAVPSRELIPDYAEIRERVESYVGQINGEYGTLGRAPIEYHYKSIDQRELAAWYLAADVLAVTPLRDGMNLVAKEYPATRVDGDGVLVLSEFCGAAHELVDALLVNPHDVDGMAHSFERALSMDEEERRSRMASLRDQIASTDVYAWAEGFLEDLNR